VPVTAVTRKRSSWSASLGAVTTRSSRPSRPRREGRQVSRGGPRDGPAVQPDGRRRQKTGIQDVACQDGHLAPGQNHDRERQRRQLLVHVRMRRFPGQGAGDGFKGVAPAHRHALRRPSLQHGVTLALGELDLERGELHDEVDAPVPVHVAELVAGPVRVLDDGRPSQTERLGEDRRHVQVRGAQDRHHDRVGRPRIHEVPGLSREDVHGEWNRGRVRLLRCVLHAGKGEDPEQHGRRPSLHRGPPGASAPTGLSPSPCAAYYPPGQ
jgi:hypothetical protein